MSHDLEIWARVGVTIDLTQEQRNRILAPEGDPRDTFSKIFQEALANDAVCLEGDSYVPGAEVQDFFGSTPLPKCYADVDPDYLEFESGLKALKIRNITNKPLTEGETP